MPITHTSLLDKAPNGKVMLGSCQLINTEPIVYRLQIMGYSTNIPAMKGLPESLSQTIATPPEVSTHHKRKNTQLHRWIGATGDHYTPSDALFISREIFSHPAASLISNSCSQKAATEFRDFLLRSMDRTIKGRVPHRLPWPCRDAATPKLDVRCVPDNHHYGENTEVSPAGRYTTRTYRKEPILELGTTRLYCTRR